ncbi:hypothetical protein [Streptomyces sp. ADI93-02]|uniref:hypothetical protein n=1 Tax=Streptomyces sp. ADI93-02 TaxID=1522757 RepID=UPI000F557C32|nr:hypothetical protein [Streptomyces sp. ADI93-02]RPK50550.1 hypothetical protein EES40_05780 [Streptomyces sp. ADI93-02]
MDATDSLFAATQMVAQMHSENVRCHFPTSMLAEVLWLDADDLREFGGEFMTASRAVEYVRVTNFNHVILDILDGTGRYDRNR